MVMIWIVIRMGQWIRTLSVAPSPFKKKCYELRLWLRLNLFRIFLQWAKLSSGSPRKRDVHSSGLCLQPVENEIHFLRATCSFGHFWFLIDGKINIIPSPTKKPKSRYNCQLVTKGRIFFSSPRLQDACG